MYVVGYTQCHMSLLGDWGGEKDICQVPSGGRSVGYVPSGGRGRKGRSLACTQWGC